MSHQQNVNPNIPQDYQPAINDTNFSAPAHSHLNNAQKSAIVEIAEGTGHGSGSGSAFGGNLAQGNIGSTAGGLGQAGTHESTFTGLGGNSGSHTGTGSSSGGLASNLRDSLSGSNTSDSSRRHDGEYNMGQSNIPHNAGGAGRDAAHLERSRNELGNVAGVHGLGNQGGSHGVGGTEGHGHGTRQAAGLGAGAGAGGLAAAASAQGLGGPSSVDRRSMEQERVGAQHGGVLDSSAPGQGGQGYGSSSGGAGMTSGRTGQGNNLQEAMRDASQSSGHGQHGVGAGAAGLGAAGAGAAGASALGGGSSSHGQSSGSGSNTGGLLSQPKAPEGGLVNELEERARKSGTHAAGFGAHGNH